MLAKSRVWWLCGVVSMALVVLYGILNSKENAVALSQRASDQTGYQTEYQTGQIAPTRSLDIEENVQRLAIGSNTNVLEAIASSQVIYLAETHNDPADHAAQLAIIQSLNEQGEVAVGLEMFQRPFQSVLDAYLADDITEEDLIAQSEYETRWGFDWEFYAPIIRYAKANQIPLLALNTPAEITRKVAVSGLESLEGDELTHIPPVDEIYIGDDEYEAAVREVFGAHGGMGHSMSFDNFFAAQVLWDETMAERVAQQLQAEPDRQVIVLAGETHILYDYGIPSRVARRVPDVDHASVLLTPDAEASDAADFVWVTAD